MDIIKLVHLGEISEDEGDDLFDKTMDEQDEGKFPGVSDFKDLVGMDNYEYTAYVHGAGLNTLARWRYKGWPEVCAVSGRKLNYKEYGWWVIEKDGKQSLAFVTELDSIP